MKLLCSGLASILAWSVIDTIKIKSEIAEEATQSLTDIYTIAAEKARSDVVDMLQLEQMYHQVLKGSYILMPRGITIRKESNETQNY